MDPSPLRAIDHDGLLRKLDAGVKPVLQKISERIETYRDEEIRALVRDNLNRCKENAAELKADGFKDGEILNSVAKTLAYRLVIKPEKKKSWSFFKLFATKIFKSGLF